MRNLIRVDLRRAMKDKIFLVLCILTGVFAVVTPLLYKAIFSLLNIEEMLEMEGMFGLSINAKSLFFTSFSPGNNFGLILPIMVAIILCKDFSHGTVRNKIICGKSRRSIFLSMLCTCAILMCGFILAQAILTLLVSLCFFDYQSTKFTIGDLGYLLLSIGLEILVYVFISVLLTFFIVSMKNAGTAIVMYFVVNFVLLIIGGITQTAAMLSDTTSGISYEILEFFNQANVFTSTVIGSGTSYGAKELLLYVLFPNVALISLFTFLGYTVFKKKDLK